MGVLLFTNGTNCVFFLQGASPSFVADIIFLVDSSGDVTPSQFSREQAFIKELSRHLNIRPGYSRASLVPYGNTADVGLRFESYVTSAEFYSAINSLRPVGGVRRADKALDTAAQLISDGRPKVPKIVVLLLAGKQDPRTPGLANAIAGVSNVGGHTYVIGKKRSLVYTSSYSFKLCCTPRNSALVMQESVITCYCCYS